MEAKLMSMKTYEGKIPEEYDRKENFFNEVRNILWTS